MQEEIRTRVAQVVKLLVEEKFSELEFLTNGVRLSAEEIKSAILSYKRKLVQPPEDAFDCMDLVEVQNSRPQQFSVRMPLWTVEEGRSDLSVELTLIAQTGDWKIELDDIHVL